jgi:hypothetical protein
MRIISAEKVRKSTGFLGNLPQHGAVPLPLTVAVPPPLKSLILLTLNFHPYL